MTTQLANLVDEGIALEREIKAAKKRLDQIKAELTTAAYADMDNKSLKYKQIFGSAGHFNATYKEKFEIDDYAALVATLGEVARAKIARKEEIKYDTDTRFKAALIAVFKGEYSSEVSVDEVLQRLGLDANTIKAVKKKLKGDYVQDKRTLESVGVTGDCEEELYAIRMYMNYQLVERFFGRLSDEQIETLRRAIFVEDGISVGFEYDSTVN
jgi:hypothetical protein